MVRSIQQHPGHSDKKRYIRLPQGSRHFTGRVKELKTMKYLLNDTKSVLQRRVVIWGVGGAGKTALASHYAAVNESQYSAIFCINATDATSFRRDCVTIAKCLGLPEALGDPTNDPGDIYAKDAVVGAVKDWLTDHPTGDWLLIVDNANNLDKFDLNEHLPSTSGGHVIITSQSKQASGFGPSIPLGEMLMEDAETLFLKRSGIGEPTSQQRILSKDIVIRLGRLALAVEHAAAYVHSSDMPLLEYLESLGRSLHTYLRDSPPDSIHKRTVQATVWMACSAVRQRSLKAALLLSFLGVLDNQLIIEELLLLPVALNILRNWQTIFDRDEYFAAKRVLLSFSLIKSESLEGDATISMHSLVHSFIQPQLSLVWQWNWLLRSAAFLRQTAESKQVGGANFAHIRFVFKSSAKLFQQPNHGQSPNELWILLAEATYKYRVYWQVQGLMQELDDLSKIVIQALEDDSDSNRLMRALVISVRLITVQFTNSAETSESVLHEFLIDQMTSQAANLIRRIHEMSPIQTVEESFHPYSLVDVFQQTTYGPYLDQLVTLLRQAVILYSGCAGQEVLATAYVHLSQLPRTESWKTQLRRTLGIATSLTRPITDLSDQLDLTEWAAIAAQDRFSGNLDSTIKLLHHVTGKGKPGTVVGVLFFEAAVYDLAKILRKLKRGDEASAVLQKLECPGGNNSEIDIARKYQDFYVWARKAHIATDSHVNHDITQAILKETYEAARKVFGKISLSTLHAGWLLQKFYSQPCCHSAEMVTRFKEETESGFTQLYSGEARLRRAEGLQIGKILLAQGALEEALFVLELFAADAERELGTRDPVTRSAKKWVVIAQRDKILEEREGVAGKASLEWGSICFPRTLSDLNVEDEA